MKTKSFFETIELFGNPVEIEWYYMAKRELKSYNKRKELVFALEKEVEKNKAVSNFFFLEQNKNIFLAMVHKSNKSINRVVIDIVDPKRLKPVEVSGRENNIYIYGASGTVFQPSVSTHSNEREINEDLTGYDS